MAEARQLKFTDEEIWQELNQLGENNVSPELFQQIKRDLIQAIEREQQCARHSPVPSSIGSSLVSSSSSTNSAISIIPDPEAEQRHRIRFEKRVNSKTSTSSTTSSFNNDRAFPQSNENVHPLNEDKNCTVPKTMTRKLFKSIEGKRILTEEHRQISNSYPGKENSVYSPNVSNANSSRAKSASTDNLCQRLSSVSVGSRGSSSSARSSSQCSGVLLPNLNVRRKKCDPVSRYHEYRKYWDTFKLPGENKHSQLRWTVRERMLDYDFA